MAGSVNKVILIGNLGRDPEIRHFPDGGKIASFSIATSESWKDRNTGERKEKTEWHRITVQNERIIDVVERFVKKGTSVYVEGALQTRKWTDKDGQEKYSTEVVIGRFRGELTLLGGRAPAGDGGFGGYDNGSAGGYDQGGNSAPMSGDNSYSSQGNSGWDSASGGGSSSVAQRPNMGHDAGLDDDIPF